MRSHPRNLFSFTNHHGLRNFSKKVAPGMGPERRVHDRRESSRTRTPESHALQLALWMATGTLPAGKKPTDPYQRGNSQTRTRTRNPRRVKNYDCTRAEPCKQQ